MRWALIIDDAVAWIDESDPAGRFDPALQWVPCGAEVEQHWHYRDGMFTPPPLPEPAALTEADYQRAIEAHVDAVAQGRRYSSAAACASYIASTEPVWAAEAAAFVAWRDAVYVAAFAALALVLAGQAEPPTIDGFISGLPQMVWPGG